MSEPRPWAVPVIGALVVAVLSSGVTTLYLHHRFPAVVALAGTPQVAPELRHVAELLVDPGGPFVATSGGRPFALPRNGLGYVRGWTRTWRAPDATLDAYVLEFSAERGAAGYAAGIGRVAGLLTKPVPFEVTGVPRASGLTDTSPDRSGRYASVVAVYRGRRAVLLLWSSAAPGPRPELVDLAAREYAALAGP
jgi:hypothetical protein